MPFFFAILFCLSFLPFLHLAKLASPTPFLQLLPPPPYRLPPPTLHLPCPASPSFARCLVHQERGRGGSPLTVSSPVVKAVRLHDIRPHRRCAAGAPHTPAATNTGPAAAFPVSPTR
eukprot:2643956-Pleurochrysis_carterae.AAC.1